MKLQEALSFIRDVPDFPKPGIVFKDICPLFQNARAFQSIVDELSKAISVWKPQKILALESRGFLFGGPVALQLNCGLVLIRKKGKLPSKTFSASYSLEYGKDEIEIQCDALLPGERCVLLDDVLATGGTLAAALQLCEQAKAEVAGAQVLLELGFLKGRAALAPLAIGALKVV